MMPDELTATDWDSVAAWMSYLTVRRPDDERVADLYRKTRAIANKAMGRTEQPAPMGLEPAA